MQNVRKIQAKYCWQYVGKLGRMLVKCRENVGKSLGRCWEIVGKMSAKYCKNISKMLSKYMMYSGDPPKGAKGADI